MSPPYRPCTKPIDLRAPLGSPLVALRVDRDAQEAQPVCGACPDDRCLLANAARERQGARLDDQRAGAQNPVPDGWEAHPVGLEELVLAYLREPGAAALPGPARGRGATMTEVAR